MEEKINFICKQIDKENLTLEFRESVLDLIGLIESKEHTIPISEHAFCCGLIMGATNKGSMIDFLSEKSAEYWDDYKNRLLPY